MQRYRPFSLKEGHGMSDVTNEPIRFGDYILYSDFVSYTDFGKEIIVEKDATIAALTERVKEAENQRAEFGMMIDAIDMILSNGEEPSDFEMSFPLVRAVWDGHQKNMELEARNHERPASLSKGER
jgi:hypothetical protein